MIIMSFRFFEFTISFFMLCYNLVYSDCSLKSSVGVKRVRGDSLSQQELT